MERQITDTNVQTEKKLTKTDLNKCFLLWHLLGEATLSYERAGTRCAGRSGTGAEAAVW